MRIIDPSTEIKNIDSEASILSLIERAGRVCYKTEATDIIQRRDFVARLLRQNHLSVIEHISATIKLICDRGISHEIVRHRLCSFSQESTRYCNYSKSSFDNQITVIKPFFFEEGTDKYQAWESAMRYAESVYFDLIDVGATPQEARTVLPNSLKTELYITANMREWRHIFDLRCSKASHPQMRQIMLPLLTDFYEHVPVLFEDTWNKYNGK